MHGKDTAELNPIVCRNPLDHVLDRLSSPAQAELPSPAILATLKAGKVESIGTASIQIDG